MIIIFSSLFSVFLSKARIWATSVRRIRTIDGFVATAAAAATATADEEDGDNS